MIDWMSGNIMLCSHSKKDVPIDSLACLLEAEYFGTADWSGSHKLARAVNNSSAVVTAFAKTSDLAALGAGEPCTASLDRVPFGVSEANPLMTLKNSHSPRGTAGSLAPAATSKLSLVGFARASSDAAFAATIHNVIVHPAVRHRGIGRNLLSRLTAQVEFAISCSSQ